MLRGRAQAKPSPSISGARCACVSKYGYAARCGTVCGKAHIFQRIHDSDTYSDTHITQILHDTISKAHIFQRTHDSDTYSDTHITQYSMTLLVKHTFSKNI